MLGNGGAGEEHNRLLHNATEFVLTRSVEWDGALIAEHFENHSRTRTNGLAVDIDTVFTDHRLLSLFQHLSFNDFSEENLDFLYSVRAMQQEARLLEDDPVDRLRILRDRIVSITRTFLIEGAPSELNITQGCRKATLAAFADLNGAWSLFRDNASLLVRAAHISGMAVPMMPVDAKEAEEIGLMDALNGQVVYRSMSPYAYLHLFDHVEAEVTNLLQPMLRRLNQMLAANLRSFATVAIPRKPHVVVVGGGCAGLTAALLLAKCDDLHVTLVDPKPQYEHLARVREHLEMGPLPEGFDASKTPVLGTAVRYRDALGANFLQGTVDALTPQEIVVDRRPLVYDYVLLCTGARRSLPSNPFPAGAAASESPSDSSSAVIPPADEYVTTWSIADTMASSQKLAVARRAVVIGGGALGIETAAHLASVYGVSLQVIIVTADQRLVQDYSKRTTKLVEEGLAALNVTWVTSTRVHRVTRVGVDKYCLQGSYGYSLAADFVLCCHTPTPNTEILRKPYFPDVLDQETGYPRLNSSAQLRGFTNMFVLGDMSGAQAPCIQAATNDAVFVARNIGRLVQGKGILPRGTKGTAKHLSGIVRRSSLAIGNVRRNIVSGQLIGGFVASSSSSAKDGAPASPLVTAASTTGTSSPQTQYSSLAAATSALSGSGSTTTSTTATTHALIPSAPSTVASQPPHSAGSGGGAQTPSSSVSSSLSAFASAMNASSQATTELAHHFSSLEFNGSIASNGSAENPPLTPGAILTPATTPQSQKSLNQIQMQLPPPTLPSSPTKTAGQLAERLALSGITAGAAASAALGPASESSTAAAAAALAAEGATAAATASPTTTVATATPTAPIASALSLSAAGLSTARVLHQQAMWVKMQLPSKNMTVERAQVDYVRRLRFRLADGLDVSHGQMPKFCYK
ncbi:hypothetical protein CXG81DRAFT_19342 [Caulochytrium protostelioides]|uniref:RGS domain-containing protein n=1 Tax=Caulochytrium protostelioides TaxID=1555241 RepID=A0A4P9X6F7_9FUNG|nr:hypothetical protein CXG81DRAFT_19342 [Caulochytrium protostelioides]|eukprot:RKP00764.1 hypothetical protein CXG81DRAFT_19342 [Caulochytrium protostelioides]